VVLFLGIEAIYLANGRAIGNNDSLPARYLPFSLLREGNFDFNEFTFLMRGGLLPATLREQSGHFYSIFSPVAGLVAIPVYLLPVLLGVDPESGWVAHLEKLAASGVTALSAVVLFVVLRRLARLRVALALTLVYAFGTSAFSISSQALWQHGPSQLFITLGLYFLVRGRAEPAQLAWSALPLAAAVAARYTNAVIVLPLLWYVARWRRSVLIPWLLLASLPALGLLAYNAIHFDSPTDISYGSAFLSPASGRWSAPMTYALPALLFSPASGLFVYSPVFLFSVMGAVRLWGAEDARLWRALAAGMIAVVLLASKFFAWWSYWYYGPRLLADLTPLLVLFLWPAWEGLRGQRLARGLFVAAVGASVLQHAIGAFGYDASWYAKPVPVEEDRIWSWRDSPFLHYGGRMLDGVGWRPTRGPALTAQEVAVRSVAAGRCHFEGVLHERVVAVPDPPRLAVQGVTRAHRAEGVATSYVELVNGGVTRNLLLHLALRRPDGRLYFPFADAGTAKDPPCRQWLPFGAQVTLPPGFRIFEDFRLGLLLSTRPPGTYTWHVLLTEPASVRVVARASGDVHVVP
jgi:hypothetical protein